MTKPEYTLTDDILFKLLFVKYPDLLKRPVAALLGMPCASINEFQVSGTEIVPEEIGKNFAGWI